MYYENIFGWTDFQNIYLEAIEQNNNCLFIELGGFMGRSSCFMAESIKQRKKNITLITVDLFPTISELDTLKHLDAGQGGAEFGEEKYIRELPKSILDTFVENMYLAGVSDIVIPIKSDSHKASKLFQDNSIPFIFVDAGHSFDIVSKDLELWWPKISKNGVMAGHDESCDGVRRAVNKFFKENKNISVEINGNSWLVRRK